MSPVEIQGHVSGAGSISVERRDRTVALIFECDNREEAHSMALALTMMVREGQVSLTLTGPNGGPIEEEGSGYA